MVTGAAPPRAGDPEGAVVQVKVGAEGSEVTRRPALTLLEGEQIRMSGLEACAELRQAAPPTLEDVLGDETDGGRVRRQEGA